jgi:hypothetical protein
MSGQLGQLFSVVPFAMILHSAGWTPAFLTLAAMSALAVVLVLAVLKDQPPGHPATETGQGLRATGISLSSAWRQPGTRLGLWSHFTIQFSGTVFAMTWGYPFLISAQGLEAATVAGLMSVYVAAADGAPDCSHDGGCLGRRATHAGTVSALDARRPGRGAGHRRSGFHDRVRLCPHL